MSFFEKTILLENLPTRSVYLLQPEVFIFCKIIALHPVVLQLLTLLRVESTIDAFLVTL